MQLIPVIKSRRSIRSYTDQKISKTDLQEIIECGMHAPSAHNQQAREFFIIQNKEKQSQAGEYLKYGKMLPDANAILIIGFDPETLKSPLLIQQDLAACTQNILLAAHEKEIGSVWIGIYPKENQDKKLNEIFGIPTDIEIFNIISLGYPNKELPLREKECIKPEKVHWL